MTRNVPYRPAARLTATPRHRAGFSLVEVLVSLVVLGIGLLGIAGLLTTGMRFNHGAYQRSQAVALADGLADRIRANPAGRATYTDQTAQENSNCADPDAGCNATALARHDLYVWQRQLADALPGGSGVVCVDATPDDGTPGATACDGSGSEYAVKLWWDDNRDGDLADAKDRFVMSFRP